VLIVDLGEKFWLEREGKLQVRKCGNGGKRVGADNKNSVWFSLRVDGREWGFLCFWIALLGVFAALMSGFMNKGR
jgi:hypothetical protein